MNSTTVQTLRDSVGRLSRRRFLQTTAVMSAGVGVGTGTAAASSPDRSQSRDRLLTADLAGGNEVPPVKTNGNGFAVFVPENDGTLSYRIRVNELQKVTQAHVHKGPSGKNGPVVAYLFRFTKKLDGSGGGTPQNATRKRPLVLHGTITKRDLVDKILAHPSQYYVNVHTISRPNGAIRGQITRTKLSPRGHDHHGSGHDHGSGQGGRDHGSGQGDHGSGSDSGSGGY